MRYRFLNLNPLGNVEEDCVTRAISLALEEDYSKISHKLYLIADLYDCQRLCVCCYKFLLDNIYQLQRIEEVQGMTVNEFCQKHPKGTFLIRLNGHLTCVIDNVLYDLWNCDSEKIDIVWQV